MAQAPNAPARVFGLTVKIEDGGLAAAVWVQGVDRGVRQAAPGIDGDEYLLSGAAFCGHDSLLSGRG